LFVQNLSAVTVAPAANRSLTLIRAGATSHTTPAFGFYKLLSSPGNDVITGIAIELDRIAQLLYHRLKYAIEITK